MSHHPIDTNLGACEDQEFDLVEWIDGTLAPDRAAAVQRHLLKCARCRAFVDGLSAVDASLAAALPRPVLSPGFDARLGERLATLRRPPAREAAWAAAEDEYRSLLGTLRRGLPWRTGLNALATASACGGVVTLLVSVGPTVLGSLGVVGESTHAATGFGIAGLACLCGLAVARLLGRQPSAPSFG